MNVLELFRDIHTLIFDVDGVLTDSNVLVLEDGKLLRRMSIRDGYALKTAVESGLNVVVITGGKSEGVKVRLQNLGIKNIYTGVRDKLDKYEEYLLLNDIDSLEEAGILYMGDDLPDYEVMRRVGLPCCPRDAAQEIVNISRYITTVNGGAGCAREVIEKILKLQGKWFEEPQSLLGKIQR